jgi:hypothetical protein
VATWSDRNSQEHATMTDINQRPTNTAAIQAAEHVYHAWDDALGRKDVAAAVSLYAEDATLESPLVRHLTGADRGVIQGHEALRAFVIKVFASQPPQRQRHRAGFFTDGRVLMWEYPRIAETGEQIDLVEVMDLSDGLIQRHRVYWGWFGLRLLAQDGHHAT